MPAVARIDPKTIFTPDEWSRLTSRSSWRGMWLVAHAWGTIIASVALVTIWLTGIQGTYALPAWAALALAVAWSIANLRRQADQ